MRPACASARGRFFRPIALSLMAAVIRPLAAALARRLRKAKLQPTRREADYGDRDAPPSSMTIVVSIAILSPCATASVAMVGAAG
jgi:hypothetical protein